MRFPFGLIVVALSAVCAGLIAAPLLADAISAAVAATIFGF